MPETCITIQKVRVLNCSPNGTRLQSEGDALELIGEAMQERAEMILLPLERLAEDFFQLKTLLAGQIIQKCVIYHLRLVILGDIAPYMARSKSFRDFVHEANRGKQVWFLAERQELDARLA